MSYYTERHGLRKPIDRTYTVSLEMYSLLFACCEKYYNNIAWRFPSECPDGHGCCGVNYKQLNTTLKFEIPNLYRDNYDYISIPEKSDYGFGKPPRYDQFALLDFIEFFAQNVRDVEIGSFHSYFGHHHLSLLETQGVFNSFRDEINGIFEKTGLLYILTEKKIVERIIENSPLSAEIEAQQQQISEVGTRELMKDAIALFKTPHPSARQDSVEKIWDALEHLKTYYTTLDKKNSAAKIVSDMAHGQVEFIDLFNSEFKALTDIGNNFRIRHHETNKIDISDSNYYDYFFNRCLSLIALAIQYLK